jgi:hypothetical protein
MKKFDAGQWATVVSNLAVFAGLVLLVIELDQSNRISSYTSENARRSQFIEINTSMIEHAEIYSKLQANAANMTPADNVRALMMARQLMNTWWDAQSAHNYGLLSEDTFQATLDDVPVTLEEAPGLLPYVAYLYYAYGDDGDASIIALHIGEVLRNAGFDRKSDRIYKPAQSD